MKAFLSIAVAVVLMFTLVPVTDVSGQQAQQQVVQDQSKDAVKVSITEVRPEVRSDDVGEYQGMWTNKTKMNKFRLTIQKADGQEYSGSLRMTVNPSGERRAYYDKDLPFTGQMDGNTFKIKTEAGLSIDFSARIDGRERVLEGIAQGEALPFSVTVRKPL